MFRVNSALHHALLGLFHGRQTSCLLVLVEASEPEALA